MRKLYTSIDIGSNSVKILVGEMYNNRLYVLASASYPSKGVKKGLIVDHNELISVLKKAINNVEGKLGIKINKVIASIPPYDVSYLEVDGYATITNDTGKVTGDDITRALQACVYNKVMPNEELITIVPVEFFVDNKVGLRDPKGIVGKKLGVRAVIVKTSKKSAYSFINVLETLGLEVVDLNLGSIGEYFEYRNKDMDKENGAIISIGDDITNVTIFNKGIISASEIIPLGGSNIENDLIYTKKINKEDAIYIKENFAVANRSYAITSETIEVFDKYNKEIQLNQLEISDIVMSRIIEILKLAKKQASLLTNKENSYIIITGGLSEMPGFSTLLSDVFGKQARIGNIETIGIRDNKYASLAGMIKYFHEKLNLRGIDYSMFSSEAEDDLITPKSYSANIKETDVLNKIIGYFFDK